MAKAAPMIKTRYRGIFKRGSKYVITYRDRQGKQRKESSPTLKEARALKQKREMEVRGGRGVDGERVLFHDFAKDWMENFKGKTVQIRPRTIKDYQQQMKRYPLVFFAKNKRIADITPGDVDEMAAWMMKKTDAKKAVSSDTVRRVLVPLRLCFDQARRKGIIVANPADRVNVPREQRPEGKPRAKALTRSELRSLLAEIPDEHQLFFKTIASTGARWSEASAWKGKDLDVKRSILRVERSLQRGVEEGPKTEESRRSIPIPKALCDELASIAQNQNGDDYLFTVGDGLPLDYFGMKTRVLEPAARKAGCDWAGFHAFRHTAASILFENGRNIKEVQQFLGHSTPEFTLNTYIHLIAEGEGQALDLEVEL
jgi:integrase